MIDGIIFDLDGTLWDTRATVAKAWNSAIKEYSNCNITVNENTFDNLFGLTNEVITEAVFPMLSKEARAELEGHCNEQLHSLLLTEPGKLYDGVTQMLQELSKEHKLFIVSNCQKGYIETFLKVTGFGKYIYGILCYGDTKMSKGMNIRQVMQKYELKTPIYVGDMKADGEAAVYAGIPILYVKYGFGEIPNADYSANTPSEVVQIIGQH